MEKNKNFLWLPIILIMMSQIGTTTDNVVLGISTLSIVNTLKVSLSDVQLANIIYAMIAGSFMIVGGFIGIIIGWKRNLQLGLILCILGELTLGLSSNITIITWIGRTLMGLGGSFLIPSALGMIPAIYEGKDRIFAFGALSTAIGIGNFIPLFAGVAIDKLGFQMVFLILAFYFAIMFILSFKLPYIEKSKEKIKNDIFGSILMPILLFLILIGLSKISAWGFIKPVNPPFTIFGLSPVLPMIILGIIILLFFIPFERNLEKSNGSALIPSAFIKTKEVRAGLLGILIMFFCFGGYGLVVNPYLQLVANFSATKLGVATVVMNLPLLFIPNIVPKLSDRYSSKKTYIFGMGLMFISTIVIALAFRTNGISNIFWFGFILSGIAQGIVLTISPIIITSNINKRDAQQSSGIQATSRNVGKSIGFALLASVMIFSMTSNFKHTLDKNTSISIETKNVILVQKELDFKSDKNFDSYIENLIPSISNSEKIELSTLNAQARKNGARNSMFIMAFIILLSLFELKNINIIREEKNA